MKKFFAVVFVLAPLGAVAAPGVEQSKFVPFEATYDAVSKSGATGTVKTTLDGGACHGWITLTETTVHLPVGDVTSSIALIESIDGDSLDYRVEVSAPNTKPDISAGHLERTAAGVVATGKVNEVAFKETFSADALLPSANDRFSMAEAVKGHRFVSRKVIVGPSKGRFEENLMTTISKPHKEEGPAPFELDGIPSFDTQSSFFPVDAVGDALPAKTMAGVDYANGVSTSASVSDELDSISLTLKSLKLGKAASCDDQRR